MACIVMPYIGMAFIVMAYASAATPDPDMADIVMAVPASQSLTMPSDPADRIREPSAENFPAMTSTRWPCMDSV